MNKRIAKKVNKNPERYNDRQVNKAKAKKYNKGETNDG